MKVLLVSLVVVLFGLSGVAFGQGLFVLNNSDLFIVSDVSYDKESKDLLVDLEYSGGCYDHEFGLDVLDCVDEICKVNVVQISGFEDHCKRIVREVVAFPIDDYFDEVSEIVIDGYSVIIE